MKVERGHSREERRSAVSELRERVGAEAALARTQIVTHAKRALGSICERTAYAHVGVPLQTESRSFVVMHRRATASVPANATASSSVRRKASPTGIAPNASMEDCSKSGSETRS